MDNTHARSDVLCGSAVYRAPKIVAAVFGARQHYALPAMMYRAGHLQRLITDFWGPSVGLRPKAWWVRSALLRSAAARCHKDIPLSAVRAMNIICAHNWWKQRNCRNQYERYSVYARQGAAFAQACTRHLDLEHDTFLGWSSTSLEAIRYESRSKVWTIIDQPDAAMLGYRVVMEEEKRFPDIGGSDAFPHEYFDRVRAEWHACNRIIVNSRWAARAIIEEGVPSDKVVICPIAYEADIKVEPKPRKEKLRVLWLGRLNPGKGLAYAIEAAKLMRGAAVQFTFAGPADIDLSKLKVPENFRYVGIVPRSQTNDLYNQHDVLLFPTLSDGFGVVQVEAMAHGLPVIATSHCGDVVEEGRSGLLIPSRDSKSIVDAITRFLDSPSFLEDCSTAAISRARDFRPDRVWPMYDASLRPQ